MKKIFFILLTLLSSSAYAAEVFKCRLKSGKTIYQSLPCESAVKQEAIEIQSPDPRKIAEEEAKLKAWKEDFAVREAARIKAEKELQAELDRKASVEALKKSAEYQKQQAREAKRQSDMLEQQYYYQPYQFYPYFPAYQFPPPYPPYPFHPTNPSRPPHVPHQHDVKERSVPDTQPAEQPKLQSYPDTDSGHSKFRFNRR